MRLFKKKCKHEHTQTITNIYGDMSLHFKGRRFVNCIDCGKEILKPDLDLKCKISNQFGSELFYLKSHDGIKGVSDGENTFDELYHERAILLAFLCNKRKDDSYKIPARPTGEYFLVCIKANGTLYSIRINIKYWKLFDIKIFDKITEPITTELTSNNFDKLLFLESDNKLIDIGDVFEMVYDYIVIDIKGYKYRIRACYPDSLEEYNVGLDWFKNAKYKKHIELK